MPQQIERRNLSTDRVEIRDAEGEPRRIQGTAVRWNSLSVDMLGFRERFAAGAFAASLAEHDVRVQWQHDGRYVFGRTSAGTARVWEDDTGLRYSAEPPAATWATDAMESIRRGDVHQNSFAFALEGESAEQWEAGEDGEPVRTILRARLIEVGPQTDPAYTDTEVALRSAPAELVRRVIRSGRYPAVLRRRAALDAARASA